MGRRISVLITDDSAFMRKALTRLITSDPAFNVIGTAKDGREALEFIRNERPDVVTLDVEMPGMNGLAALVRIKEEYPFLPVIMVSSITKSGTDIAIQCLENGAYDIVCKPESYVSMNIADISRDLLDKLRGSVFLKDQKRTLKLENLAENPAPSRDRPDEVAIDKKQHFLPTPNSLVTIGCSTGGPQALLNLLPKIPSSFPVGMVIVQHMPAGGFIHSLAERLNTNSAIDVQVAEDGQPIRPGLALIAPIGRHTTIERNGKSPMIRLVDHPEKTNHKPSVDVLFESAAKVVGEGTVSCILTGMGSDGVRGLSKVVKAGGYVIAESEESCAIFGMPRCAIEANLVHAVAPLERIPGLLMAKLNDQTRATNSTSNKCEKQTPAHHG
jgi:two-component system chemotaxis response regulator CheB